MKRMRVRLDGFGTRTVQTYRQTIHRWRQKRKHPETVTEDQWAKWTAVWDNQDWEVMASKYKENKNAEPAGLGTGMTKHIAGSKCYAIHVKTLHKKLTREPTSWEIFVHTHRRTDGTFVDERSRLLHEQMEAYLEEALTPFGDETIPNVPLPHEINRQFMIISGGPKKGKMYGLSTIASTIYPEAMATRPRGSVDAGQSLYALREKARESRDEARTATQRAKETEERAVEAHREYEELSSRVSSLEESVCLLFGGMSRGSHRTILHMDEDRHRRAGVHHIQQVLTREQRRE